MHLFFQLQNITETNTKLHFNHNKLLFSKSEFLKSLQDPAFPKVSENKFHKGINQITW